MADTQSARRIAYSPTPFSTWLGIVCLFVLFGLIVLAVVGPMPRSSNYEQTRAENRMKKLKDARDEDAKALSGYSWIDKNKGTVRIPIERAMELTAADLARNKPAPAYPIATPESQPSPAPASPAKSPAPAAASTVPAAAAPTASASPAASKTP